MYDQNKTCKFYAAGYCRRGADCWFLHRDPGAVKPTAKAAAASTSSEDEEHVCSICLEKPVTFGLLGKCYGYDVSVGPNSCDPCSWM